MQSAKGIIGFFFFAKIHGLPHKWRKQLNTLFVVGFISFERAHVNDVVFESFIMDHSKVKVRTPECTAFPWHLLRNHNAIYSCHPFTKVKQTHLYIINSENEVKRLIKKNAICSNLKCLLLSNVNIQIFLIWSLSIFVKNFSFLSFDTRLENTVSSISLAKLNIVW